MITIAMSKLAHIACINPKIKDKMADVILDVKNTINQHMNEDRDIDDSTEKFLIHLSELMNFNLFLTNKQQSLELYDMMIKFYATIIFPSRERFSVETMQVVVRCINIMYIWFSEHIISKQDNMHHDDAQDCQDLSLFFMNVFKFYASIFEDKADEADTASDEWKIKSYYLKSFCEFLLSSSNDVLSTKHAPIYQEISKDQINTL
jgi:hypothetical protein